MSHQASCILQTQGQNPEHPSIQLTAPTGCAAFKTGGATLRSAWKLSLKGFYSLRGNTSLLATYESKFENSHYSWGFDARKKDFYICSQAPKRYKKMVTIMTV